MRHVCEPEPRVPTCRHAIAYAAISPSLWRRYRAMPARGSRQDWRLRLLTHMARATTPAAATAAPPKTKVFHTTNESTSDGLTRAARAQRSSRRRAEGSASTVLGIVGACQIVPGTWQFRYLEVMALTGDYRSCGASEATSTWRSRMRQIGSSSAQAKRFSGADRCDEGSPGWLGAAEGIPSA